MSCGSRPRAPCWPRRRRATSSWPWTCPRSASAARKDTARADRPAEFALETGGLRPSIETSLHAVIPQRVVVHVHSIATIARAIRSDAKADLAAALAPFDWAFVPYVKPGANLARAVAERLGPATDVVVLGNHGLIVAAETVAGADALLARVEDALAAPPRPWRWPDAAALRDALGAGYAVPEEDAPLHQLALDPETAARATAGSLYPDHVIFCGAGATALAPGETADAARARAEAAGLPAPVFLIVPGAGCLIRTDASEGAKALARCLADVLVRVPDGAALSYLSEAQTLELLDWDAEKYRQALNAS